MALRQQAVLLVKLNKAGNHHSQPKCSIKWF